MIEQHGSDAFEGKVCTVSLERGGRDGARGARRDRRPAPDARRERRLDGADRARGDPRLDPFEIFYYEDPVETHEELAQLRGHTGASFSTHVIDLGKALALGVPDAIVTNLNELGGIRRTVEFIAACARFDLGFRFHSGETGIATAAYLGVSGAIEHVREPSQTLVRWYADDVIEGGPSHPSDGALPGADGAGARRHARSRGAPALPRALPARGRVPERRCEPRLRRVVPAPLSSEAGRVHRDVARGERCSVVQREPPPLLAEVSKRRPATTM